LRGAGHLGVLRQLTAHKIPVHVIVGSSAGAIVAAFYAAVGLDLDQLIRDARGFRARHLVAHAVNVRLRHRHARLLGSFSGIIPARLEQLEGATFDQLHHGVEGIGIVCHDVASGSPRYFSTGNNGGARLSDVVRASASLPHLFPPIAVDCSGERVLLTDGGVSDCLPIAFARRPPLSATHVIVSDCRLFSGPPPVSDRLVYLRPGLPTTGTLWSPSSTLLAAVRDGAATVSDDVLACIRSWTIGSVQGAG
jgi:NTE family protein